MNTLRSIWKVVLELSDVPVTKSFNKSKSSTQTNSISWEDSLVTIFSFKSASDFWCWFDNSILLSSITLSQIPRDNFNDISTASNKRKNIESIRVFKNNISLLRESSDNCYGGRICFEVFKSDENREHPMIDKIWLVLLMWLITIDQPILTVVNGVVANLRFDTFNETGLSKSFDLFSVRFEIWLGSPVIEENNVINDHFINSILAKLVEEFRKQDVTYEPLNAYFIKNQ
eukprot:gene16637-22735_t